MEDRYLFKAKRLDTHDWILGFLSMHKTGKYFIRPIGGSASSSEEVDKNTICQCTCLKDKNGNLIWENDIIELYEDIYIVTWEEDDAMFALEDASIVEHFSHVDCKWCEVVGNKFENPELLESEE